MSGSIRLHNPGQFEQVIDTDGHVLGGGESRVVDSTDAYTDVLIARGVILSAPSEPSLINRRNTKSKPLPADGDTKGIN
jgi:hypothetical protein